MKNLCGVLHDQINGSCWSRVKIVGKVLVSKMSKWWNFEAAHDNQKTRHQWFIVLVISFLELFWKVTLKGTFSAHLKILFGGPEIFDFNLYKGFFMEKKDPYLPDFWIFFFQNWHIFLISSHRWPIIRKDCGIFLLSYLVCSPSWLHHFMDDCHHNFSYITKLKKKTIHMCLQP
jgi:hypothetical protein